MMEESRVELDEQKRYGLQEYIFDLEEIKEGAEELTIAYEKLKGSQDLLLSVLSCTVHGLCLIKDQKFVWCNKAMMDIFGWNQEDLIGKTMEMLSPGTDEDKKIGEVTDSVMLQGGLMAREYEFVHKSGRRVPCFVTGCALDEKVPAKDYVLSITDFSERNRSQEALKRAYDEMELQSSELIRTNEQLNREIEERKLAEENLIRYREQLEELVEARTRELTRVNEQLRQEIVERRRAEEDLKKANDYLESILKNSPDAIAIVNKHARVVKWSKMATALYGSAFEELEGRRAYEFYADPAELAGMLAQLRRDGFVSKHKVNMKRKGGATFPAEISVSLLKDNDNRTIGSVAILRDLSDIQKMLDTLRKTNEQLKSEIAARQEVEISLRKSENVYRAIFENKGTATVILEEDTTISLVNAEFEKLSGFSKKEIEGRKKWTEFVVEEDLERMKERHRLRRIDPEAAPPQYEFRFRNRFGEIRHIFLSVTMSPGGGRTVASLLDITERKQVEEWLKESQQQLADIINFLPDATLVIDMTGRVIAWNKAMEEMTGIEARDILGKGNYEYALPFYGKRRPILIDLVIDPEEKTEADYEKIERKDFLLSGETYVQLLKEGGAYLFGKASVLRDSRGNIVGAIESIRDITERKRVEESLAQAEEKYRSIFENAIEGISQTSLEGRLLSANPALARILGYDSPEAVINKLTDISKQIYVDPERRTELLRLIEEWGSVRGFEAQFFRKDKSIAWVALNLRAVHDKNGNAAYLEGTVQDITDRKLLESQLIQAQKMEAIGTLAGGIAHDFNNILAAILGYTELTKGRLQQKELHGYLDRVLQACDRAKNLVAQILTFSRQAEQERKPLDLRLIINETLKLIRATLPSTIEIRQKIASEVHAVFADSTQIHQILINLCTNAAHAMREKGGRLEITLDNVEIVQKMSPLHSDLTPGPYVKLTVSDTGTGIAPEVIHRIFDPFFTTKKQGEGTGLGLSMVYGILRGYGGTITVQSEPGAGSIFGVYLPAMGQDMEVKLELPQAIFEGTEQILLVDDEDILMEMGRDMLETLGYQVTATTDSCKALEIFQSRCNQFDLVITDMTMPGMTGADLSKEILRIRPNIPIVLCTGFSEIITEEEAKGLGIREFLMKPLNMRSLAEIIRMVLRNKDS
jgi:PAS domain S-box-containing protein